MPLAHPRRSAIRAAVTLAMTVAAAGATIPVAQAIPPQPVFNETTDIAFSGVFDGSGVNEPVDVTGTVHIAVHTDIGDTGGIKGIDVSIHTNLSDTHGIGEVSHGRYVFTGSDSLTRTIPPQPIRIDFFPVFKAQQIPPVPIYPPNPCRLLDEAIHLNGDGSISGIAAFIATSGVGGGGGGGPG
jgi:hypothetical protein